MFQDFIKLLFPELCPLCGNSLFKNENYICSKCLFDLPRTEYHLDSKNPLAKIFWGRTKTGIVSSFLFFRKGSRVQNLLHAVKYEGMPELAEYMGKVYAEDLLKVQDIGSSSQIIPVPLHITKERKRGFNQSEFLASGLSAGLGIPLSIGNLVRISATETQTKKSRYARWANVKQVFYVKDPEKFKGQNLILVDDVITTGSTLEACMEQLMNAGASTVHLICLACAK